MIQDNGDPDELRSSIDIRRSQGCKKSWVVMSPLNYRRSQEYEKSWVVMRPLDFGCQRLRLPNNESTR